MKNIAIFASGHGTNAERITRYFSEDPDISVRIILSNNPGAFVIERAKKLGIPYHVFDRNTFYKTEEVLQILRKNNTDLIVLAGFMWLVPEYLIRAYPGKIINIHPALLPKYGGKGMYGHHVHEAVLEQGCKVSGVTVHLVDELFDHGPIVKQRCVPVLENDSADSLAARVLVQEHQIFAEALQIFAENRVEIKNHRAIILPGKERD